MTCTFWLSTERPQLLCIDNELLDSTQTSPNFSSDLELNHPDLPTMNPCHKRASPDATSAPATSKKPKILTTPSGVALPQKHWFDPWNSSSTGHQRAENNLAGSTSWRDSRNLKLGAQYQGGRGGGKRVADTVGAGSEDWGKDGRKVNGSWRDGAKGLREKTQPSLRECLGSERKKSEERESPITEGANGDFDEDDELNKAIAASLQEAEAEASPQNEKDDDLERAIAASMAEHSTSAQPQADNDTIPPSNQADYYDSHLRTQDLESEVEDHEPKQIFHNLVFYINGSTAPLISDHKLKFLITAHGGSLTIQHMRKQVTHVIIGTTHERKSNGLVGGAGGALASTKIQKEIARTRGKGVKFVGAQWVIDSVEKGRRMGEARYENLKLGGAGQGSVFDKFKTAKPGVTSGGGKRDGMTDEELGIS